MKTVTFMNRQRGNVNNDNVLHIEVPGAIVNVYIDLFDAINDRKVTRVEVKPDDYAGEEWRIDEDGELIDFRSVRLVSVPGYRKQQHEFAERMKIEASHMVKIDPDIDRTSDLLKDIQTFLLGNGAQAIDTILEYKDAEDTDPHSWMVVDEQRRDLVGRITAKLAEL